MDMAAQDSVVQHSITQARIDLAALQVGAFASGREVQVIGEELAAKMAPVVRGVYLSREADLHFAAQKRLLDRAGADYTA